MGSGGFEVRNGLSKIVSLYIRMVYKSNCLLYIKEPRAINRSGLSIQK